MTLPLLKKIPSKHSIIVPELDNNDILVIVFSDLRGGGFFESLKPYADYIFVQGQANWHCYTDWEHLKELTQDYKDKTVITTGMSMGGTGALMAPHYIKVDYTVAFVPQIDLPTSNWKKYYNPSMTVLECAKIPHQNTQYYIHTGELKDDVSQANILKDYSNVKITLWNDCKDHQLPKYLKSKGLLISSILNPSKGSIRQHTTL